MWNNPSWRNLLCHCLAWLTRKAKVPSVLLKTVMNMAWWYVTNCTQSSYSEVVVTSTVLRKDCYNIKCVSEPFLQGMEVDKCNPLENSFSVHISKGQKCFLEVLVPAWYDFVACDELTTGLRHELSCVNQTYNSLTTLKSCRRPVVSLSNATKSCRVNRPLETPYLKISRESNSLGPPRSSRLRPSSCTPPPPSIPWTCYRTVIIIKTLTYKYKLFHRCN